jgi:predicted N-acetyltransferase YhbS
MMLTVRAEPGRDVAAVRSVHRAAFPPALESKVVDPVRAAGKTGVDEPFVAPQLKWAVAFYEGRATRMLTE